MGGEAASSVMRLSQETPPSQLLEATLGLGPLGLQSPQKTISRFPGYNLSCRELTECKANAKMGHAMTHVQIGTRFSPSFRRARREPGNEASIKVRSYIKQVCFQTAYQQNLQA